MASNNRSRYKNEDDADSVEEIPIDLHGYEECYCVDESSSEDIIPYVSVYDSPEDEKKRPFFIKSKPVVATIENVRKNTEQTFNFRDSYVYTIKLVHGPYTWTVERCYSDFNSLNQKLKLYRAALFFVGPLKSIVNKAGVNKPINYTTLTYTKDGLTDIYNYNEKKSYNGAFGGGKSPRDNTSRVLYSNVDDRATIEKPEEESNIKKKSEQKHRHKIPEFPFFSDMFVSEEKIQSRKFELQNYLNAVLSNQDLRNHKETAAFLDVSHLSFVHNLGYKHKEGIIQKRQGGRFRWADIKMYWHEYCAYCCKYWDKRWLVAKDSFVSYVNPGTNAIREVLLFDQAFRVKQTGFGGFQGAKGMSIENYTRTLLVKTESEADVLKWKSEIEEVLRTTGKIWLDVQQFGSLCPPRQASYANWFIDGRTYFAAVADMLELAKEEIFIAGWFLTAEIFLKRPPLKHKENQLMQILKRKADEGVYICVMIWKEMEFAVANGSAHAKNVLSELSPKIIVMRHPEYVPPTWWSHHEKIIIIDQNIAFIGGIDLSYGRWDDYNHRLVDLGSQPTQGKSYHDPAYSQSSTLPMSQVQYMDPGTSCVPPAYRHPVGPGRAFYENPVMDTAGDIVETKKPNLAILLQLYDRYLKSDEFKRKQKRKNETPPMKRKETKLKKAFENWKDRNLYNNGIYDEFENFVEENFGNDVLDPVNYGKDNGQLWIGKDYVNFLFKDLMDLEHPYLDFIDREKVCRLPWHDISSVVFGSAARDTARHFIQRWNQVKNEKYNYDPKYPFLVPKSYENAVIADIFRQISHKCTTQVLHSVSGWSAGVNTVSDSILQAYCHIITNAEHYVYIENQYFISMIGSGEVRNGIATALFNRIVKAHRLNQKFRVIVTLPLLPAFPGELGTMSGLGMQTLLYYVYKCIWKGESSLFQNLEREIGDYSEYVSFYALRTHSTLQGKPITEVVYVHSKIIIVDDKFAIIGSANLNDRSMMGDGDSEVCLYVEDSEYIPATMGGRPYKVGKFGSSMRKQLFGEHLGLLDEHGKYDENSGPVDITDFTSDRVYNYIKHRAYLNSAIYEKVFQCFPTDSVRTFPELTEYKKNSLNSMANTNPDLAQTELAKIQGFIVEFPLKFLADEDLAAPIYTYQGLAQRFTNSFL